MINNDYEYDYEYDNYDSYNEDQDDAGSQQERGVAADTSGDSGEGSIVAALAREANKYEQLTADQEKELAGRIKEGDAEARELFINSNLKLAISLAYKKYYSFQAAGKNYLNICLDDIVQSAMIGLVKAADKFDPEIGTRFSTVASIWIRREMDRGLHDSMRTVQIPERMEELFTTINKVRKELALQNSGEAPSDDELAAAMVGKIEGMTQEKAIKLLALEIQVSSALSLDAKAEGDEDELGSIADTISDPDDKTGSQDDSTQSDHEIADAILTKLTPIEQNIICMTYGIHGEKKLSLRDAAVELYNRGFTSRSGEQMTGEAVRQKRKAALEKMQKIYKKHYQVPECG